MFRILRGAGITYRASEVFGPLPRLGRHAEALVETQSFLDAQPEAEDRAEMRLLRGDIYRAIFQDPMSAEREYEEGAESPGRTGDDSRFLHALCLEALAPALAQKYTKKTFEAEAKTGPVLTLEQFTEWKQANIQKYIDKQIAQLHQLIALVVPCAFRHSPIGPPRGTVLLGIATERTRQT